MLGGWHDFGKRDDVNVLSRASIENCLFLGVGRCRRQAVLNLSLNRGCNGEVTVSGGRACLPDGWLDFPSQEQQRQGHQESIRSRKTPQQQLASRLCPPSPCFTEGLLQRHFTCLSDTEQERSERSGVWRLKKRYLQGTQAGPRNTCHTKRPHRVGREDDRGTGSTRARGLIAPTDESSRQSSRAWALSTLKRERQDVQRTTLIHE